MGQTKLSWLYLLFQCAVRPVQFASFPGYWVFVSFFFVCSSLNHAGICTFVETGVSSSKARFKINALSKSTQQRMEKVGHGKSARDPARQGEITRDWCRNEISLETDAREGGGDRQCLRFAGGGRSTPRWTSRAIGSVFLWLVCFLEWLASQFNKRGEESNAGDCSRWEIYRCSLIATGSIWFWTYTPD